MKSDISRITFHPAKHYSAVRLQQGRVQMDADFNEQTDILNHREQTAVRDTLGLEGAPLENGGFRVDATDGGTGLEISAGRLYQNGLLLENETGVSYLEQPDLPKISLPDTDGIYLAYLETRQTQVTALEDPRIREIALGGVETATREKVLWQVKLEQTGTLNDIGLFNSQSTGSAWTALLDNQPGRMSARSQPDHESDLCGVGERGGYSLPENKLYRVEIHQGGSPGTATYKWSRDNAILVTEWLEQNQNILKVRNVALDDVLRFTPGKWIEITDERLELKNLPGVLVPILSVEEDSISVNLDQTLYTPETLAELGLQPEDLPRLDILDFDQGRRKIRLWDMTGSSGLLNIPNDGEWFELEENIQLKFDETEESPVREYKTGDYWLIPARVALRNIEWGCENDAPAVCPPTGNVSRFQRLAFLKRENGLWERIADCRRIFPGATDLTLSYVGGDGQECRPEEAAPLSEPLSVRVSRGQVPVIDVPVRFQLRDLPQSPDDGELIDLLNPQNKGNSVIALTNEDGLARVYWRPAPDRSRVNQTVQAFLTNDQDEVLMWIDFNANLSLAAAVSYDTTGGGPDASALSAPTSQAALDNLFLSKVNRAGDTITGSLTVDQDVEIKGNLIVSGDVTAKDEEHVKGSVELGDDSALDFVTFNSRLRGPRLSDTEFGPLLVEGDEFISQDLKIAGKLGVGYGKDDALPANALLSAGPLTITDEGFIGISEESPNARLHISSAAASGTPPLRVEAREQGVGGRTYFLAVDVVNDSTEDLLNFQIRLSADTATPIANGHMRADCEDIRFVDEDQITPLLHWVESGKNSVDTLFWVKLPLLPASGTRKIYMYYGNPQSAGGESPLENVLNGEITGVIGAWRLESATGQDDSGQGHTGALRGSPSPVPGMHGSALRFDGQGDAVVIPSSTDFNISESFSISAWFNSEGPGSGYLSANQSMILAKHFTNNARSYSLEVSHIEQKIYFDLFEPNNNAFILKSNALIGFNIWYHVTAIYNKAIGQARIYLNGVLDSIHNVGQISIMQTSVPLTIGCYTNTNDASTLRGFFKGALNEVHFYKNALSAVQVQTLYESRSYFSPALPGHELLRQHATLFPALQVGPEENDTLVREQTALFVQENPGYVGIGTAAPNERLSVNGIVQSMSGGFRFPDGTVQATAWTETGTVIPQGAIMMWSGSVADIPEGWTLCNGTNGAPALGDRFIVGAGNSYVPGEVGGADEITLTLAQIPSHSHSVVEMIGDNNVDGVDSATTRSGEHHNEPRRTGSEGGNQAHENRPPYYALCYIFKI